MSELDLAGKNCIVTGATGGLGRCIVKHLWRRGASIMLVMRSHRMPLALFFENPVVPAQTVAMCFADLGSPADAADGLEAGLLRSAWPHVDALINSAAVLGPIGHLERNSWLAWEYTVCVNLLAPVALCRAAIPFMKDSGGSIVNLSGGGATKARPNFSAYACAKTALIRFTETFAQEVAQYNIRVNAVAPGRLATAMNKQVITAGEAAAGVEEYRSAVQRGSQGDLRDEAAALVGFLASDKSIGISGKLISAVWDDWRNFSDPQIAEMQEREDLYTLRRVT